MALAKIKMTLLGQTEIEGMLLAIFAHPGTINAAPLEDDLDLTVDTQDGDTYWAEVEAAAISGVVLYVKATEDDVSRGCGYVKLTNTTDVHDVKSTAAEALAELSAAQAEPGQGAPPVNASPLTKLAYLYKSWRNKKIQTTGQYSLYSDDGVTVDQKGITSDVAGVTTIGEVVSGP